MRFLGLLLLSLLLACSEDAASKRVYTPKDMDDQARGYYTHMAITTQKGPKAQIWLTDQDTPIWFTSPKDAVFFIKNPEEADNIGAVFVTDMKSLEEGASEFNWLRLAEAFLVIDSDVYNALGFKDVIPFEDEQAAMDFIKRHGGRLVKDIDEIAMSYLNAPMVEKPQPYE